MEQEMEKVSIVVPVYNSEQYLVRCIDSLRNQSYENLEIILVDDGSQDSSFSLCCQAAQTDSRIKVIHQENGGAARARNRGILEASGKWLMLIDADDYIHQDMAGDLLKAAHEEDAQGVICGFSRVYGDGTKEEIHALQQKWSGDLHRFSEEMLLPLYRNLLLRTQSNKLYDLSLIQKNKLAYPGGFSINEDIWFCVRYLSLCRRIVCIPGSYLYYWQNQGGDSLISRYHPEGVESCFLLLKAMNHLMKKADSSPAVRNEMENEMLFHICGFAGHIYYRANRSPRECLDSIRQLTERKEFRRLLRQMRPRGIKNKTAAFLLGRRMCRVYHWMCLGLYAPQRRRFFKESRGKAKEG